MITALVTIYKVGYGSSYRGLPWTPVPETKIKSRDVTYRLYGFFDYALGFIHDIGLYSFTFLLFCSFFDLIDFDTISLIRGTLTPDAHETLCGVIEVKSLR